MSCLEASVFGSTTDHRTPEGSFIVDFFFSGGLEVRYAVVMPQVNKLDVVCYARHPFTAVVRSFRSPF